MLTFYEVIVINVSKEEKLMKKVLKTIVIVLLFLVILIIIHTIRNFVIILSLQDKIQVYSNSTNYHIKSFSTFGDGILTEMDYYKNDSKSLKIVKKQVNEMEMITRSFSDGENINTYIEIGENKTVMENSSDHFENETISNGLELANIFNCLISKISRTEIDGKQCYKIGYFFGPRELYIEKDTGLTIKNIVNEQYINYEFDFNNVDDNVFKEPDISEYEVQITN